MYKRPNLFLASTSLAISQTKKMVIFLTSLAISQRNKMGIFLALPEVAATAKFDSDIHRCKRVSKMLQIRT
jgi:hypothetical protein